MPLDHTEKGGLENHNEKRKRKRTPTTTALNLITKKKSKETKFLSDEMKGINIRKMNPADIACGVEAQKRQCQLELIPN